MNVAETQAEPIDPALKEAGWGVVDGSKAWRIALTLRDAFIGFQKHLYQEDSA